MFFSHYHAVPCWKVVQRYKCKYSSVNAIIIRSIIFFFFLILERHRFYNIQTFINHKCESFVMTCIFWIMIFVMVSRCAPPPLYFPLLFLSTHIYVLLPVLLISIFSLFGHLSRSRGENQFGTLEVEGCECIRKNCGKIAKNKYTQF